MKSTSRNSHHKISESLRRRIDSGALKQGDRLPSFDQMHREFGAAARTVSRALDTLEQDGLIVRRPGSGVYVTDHCPTKKAYRIAIAGAPIQGFMSDYWARLIAGIQSEAHEAGVEATFLPTVDRVQIGKYDGVLIYDICRFAPDLDFSSLPDFAVVSMGATEPGIPSVVINEQDACYLAAQHLVQLGHQRIGYIGWLETMTACFRLAGYHRALSEKHLPLLNRFEERLAVAPGIVPLFDFRLIRPIGHCVHGGASSFRDTSRINMLQWLDEDFADLGCTALIAQNDEGAAGVVDALTQRGYSVPGDISVIGFDNERSCATENPTLSSVGANMFDLGASAVEVLLKAIAGEQKPPAVTWIQPSLYARGSTGPAPNS